MHFQTLFLLIFVLRSRRRLRRVVRVRCLAAQTASASAVCPDFLNDYAAVRSVCEERSWRVVWAASQNADICLGGSWCEYMHMLVV